MSKIQIKTEIDLLAILPQLATSDLERYAKEIAKLLAQRKTKNKKAKITELLRTLNQECILSEKEINRFYELRTKRTTKELTPKELNELFQLIKTEEHLRIKRIRILGEISILRNVPLAKLNRELGIKLAESA